MFLNNANPKQKVVSQHAQFGDTAVLFTDSSHFAIQPGMEIKLGKYCDSITAVEISYFGLHHFNGSASVTDPNERLATPFSMAGTYLDDFDQAFQQGFSTSSEVHNVELNLRRHLTQPIWLVAGLRYIN